MKKTIVVFALLCAILTAHFLGVGLDLPTVYAADLTPPNPEDPANPPNPVINDFITGLDITDVSPNETDDLTDNADVAQNGAFRMTYSFSIPQTSGLTDTDYFFLDLPSYVHVPSNVENIAIIDSAYSIHVLDVSMLMASHPNNTTGEDAIRIDFTSQLELWTDTFAFTGEFWFEANFDEDQVDEGGNITINFDSGRVSAPYAIDIDFIEDPPADPTFVKSVSRLWSAAEHRHYYEWTLDLNPENVDLGTGVVIVDTLPLSNTELEYIGNINQTNGTAGYTSNYDSTTHTLEIEFTNPVTERQTFTFETAFYDTIYMDHLANSDRTINVANQASAQTPVGTITSNISEQNTWIDVINKRDTNVDIANRQITWRIEANPNDYIIEDAYVVDDLPTGLFMDESTITITYDDGTSPAPSSWSVDDQGTADLNDDVYTFTLYDPLITNTISEEIWITFTTDIDPDLYYTQDNDDFVNSAYFHPLPYSNRRNRGRDTVPFTTDVIQKTSSAVNIADGIITWQIHINPNTTVANPVTLEDLVVTDPIPDNIETVPASANSGLSYISGTITVSRGIEDEVTGADAYYDSGNDQIVVDFDATAGVDEIDLDYIITYQTQIVDDYIYKINADSSVENTVSYTSSNAGASSDTATRDIEPDVLQKTFISYDYDTHQFRWHIHVNTNQTELENALVTDYITDDMTYVDGSFEIFDSSSNPYAGGTFIDTEHTPAIVNPQNSSEYITYTLEYQFPATVTDSYDIYFETEYVNLAGLEDNHLDLTTDYLEANNTVYLDHDDMPSGDAVLISDGQRFTSSVIEKAPDYTNGNQFIDWVVTINKNQIDILGPNPDPYPSNAYTGPVIYDTLQEGLVIDIESIVLYEAEVHPDNTIDTDPDNNGSNNIVPIDDGQITYDANTRQLTFEFADDIHAADAVSCYVMTFRTYIESGYSGGSFDNTASFHALAGNDTNTSDNEDVLFATGGGYAAANIGHLLITKVDEESGDPLSGAKFELIDASGTVVDVQETDINGEALFEFVFFDRQYYYRESEAPYGYSADTTTLTGFVIDTATATDEADDPDRTHEPDESITNSANAVTVQLTKHDDTNTPLQGATFTISESGSPANIIATVTSDENGLVAFTNLPANRTYEVIEILPPIGYIIDPASPGPYTVVCTVGDVPFPHTPLIVTNLTDSTDRADIVFTKFAEDGTTYLQGCVFGIYSAALPNSIMGTATSQADGLVTFNDVPIGSYIIRELSSPTGYEVSPTELTVTINAGSGTFATTPDTLTNYLDGTVEVEVHSTFSLSGMSFRIGLYRISDNAFMGQLQYVNGTLTNFTRLEFDTYAARIMSNSHGLIGASQNGTITISATHTHVDIYITRNPQTGDETIADNLISIGLMLLIVVCCVAYIYIYYKRKPAHNKAITR